MFIFILTSDKRGIGLGMELHRYAIQFFANNGVNEYHLRVSPTNHHALYFYSNNGMEEIGCEQDGKVIRMKATI